MYSANIVIKGDPKILYKCFQKEGMDYERSKFTIKKTKEGLNVEVTAKDAVAFRATLNSIARLLIVFEGVKKF